MFCHMCAFQSNGVFFFSLYFISEHIVEPLKVKNNLHAKHITKAIADLITLTMSISNFINGRIYNKKYLESFI